MKTQIKTLQIKDDLNESELPRTPQFRDELTAVLGSIQELTNNVHGVADTLSLLFDNKRGKLKVKFTADLNKPPSLESLTPDEQVRVIRKFGKAFARGKAQAPISELGFEGRTAIITGGSGGIGRECVRILLALGANVVIADIDKDKGLKLEKRLRKDFGAGEKIKFIEVDLADQKSVENLVQKTVETFGAIDHMVCGAATFPFKKLKDYTEADHALAERHYQIGVAGHRRLITNAWQQYPESRNGSIVVVSSIVADAYEPGAIGYTEVKSAEVGMGIQLAGEISEDGYKGRVSVLKLGHTWAVDGPHYKRAKAEGKTKKEYERGATNIQMTMHGRFIDPQEAAAQIVWQLSDCSKPLTGSVVEAQFGARNGAYNFGYETMPENNGKKHKKQKG